MLMILTRFSSTRGSARVPAVISCAIGVLLRYFDSRRSVELSASTRSVVADSGVDPAVKEVGQEVAEEHQEAEHHEDGHTDHEVVAHHRVEQELAHPGIAEHRLGDGGSREEAAKRPTDHGDEGEQ